MVKKIASKKKVVLPAKVKTAKSSQKKVVTKAKTVPTKNTASKTNYQALLIGSSKSSAGKTLAPV